MLGAVLVMLGGVAPAAADPGPAAPAVDGAAAGGAVIVVLKDQHADITLKAEGAQRTATTQSDQRSIVSDITPTAAPMSRSW